MYRESLLGKIDRKILNYISSLSEDREIAYEVLEVLKAHVETLHAQKLIPQEAGKRILKELEVLMNNPEELFKMDAEDIHEAIEIYLNNRLGKIAGYIPLGRSRNDHISAALRLKTKRMLKRQIEELIKLRDILLKRGEDHLFTMMPACTHLQPAQISTFAHYLCYIEEELAEYTKIIFEIYRVVDKSPLGGGAVAGTMVPIDRVALGKKLFDGVVWNSIRASGSREFLSLALSVDTSLSVFLSRIVEDMIVFSLPQFSYIILPADHAATSSMMPQKRNAATMEIARAWGAESIGHLVAFLGTLRALPSGYNLDMQESNHHAYAILKNTLKAIQIFSDFFSKIEVNSERMKEDTEIYPILATDMAERIALKRSMPYRAVHAEIAKFIGESRNSDEFYSTVKRKYGLEMNPQESILRPVMGSPDPKDVKKYIEQAKKLLEEHKSELFSLEGEK